MVLDLWAPSHSSPNASIRMPTPEETTLDRYSRLLTTCGSETAADPAAVRNDRKNAAQSEQHGTALLEAI